jgi:microcystin-dependent protein
MPDPFLGELKLMSFNFAPQGWAQCNGQVLPINQNQALFSLLGTTYGGNGQTTFALPDLRGRAPVHRGKLTQGQKLGEEFHTLNANEMAGHNHGVMASSQNGNQAGPKILAGASNAYTGPSNLTPIAQGTVSKAGGGQPHENRQPYLVLNWCIALQGIFPSRASRG